MRLKAPKSASVFWRGLMRSGLFGLTTTAFPIKRTRDKMARNLSQLMIRPRVPVPNVHPNEAGVCVTAYRALLHPGPQQQHSQMATVLIQGASRGLGLQFARALAARDSVSAVVATCRRPEQASELRALPKVRVLPLDVTSEASVQSAAEQVAGITAGLDLLVNCSAILHPSGRGETSLRDLSLAGLQDTFVTNTFGPLLVAKHFAPLLQSGSGALGVQAEDAKQRHAAVLVNMTAKVGSIGENVLGGWYSYRMSKAALNMATKNLSIELGRGRKKVLCVGLHPGTVDTDLSRPYHKNVPKDQLFSTEKSVSHLLAIVDGLTVADTGKVFVWSGEQLPF